MSGIVTMTQITFGEMYFTGNAINTVIATVNVPVKIVGTTTVGHKTNDLTHTNGRLTYTGANIKKFFVKCSASVKRGTGSGTKEISLLIARTFVVVPATEIVTTPNGNNIIACTCQGIIELPTGNCIEIFIKNRTDSNDLLVTHIDVIINEFLE